MKLVAVSIIILFKVFQVSCFLEGCSDYSLVFQYDNTKDGHSFWKKSVDDIFVNDELHKLRDAHKDCVYELVCENGTDLTEAVTFTKTEPDNVPEPIDPDPCSKGGCPKADAIDFDHLECDATYLNKDTESVIVKIVDDSHCDDKCFKLDWSDKGDKVDTGDKGDKVDTGDKGDNGGYPNADAIDYGYLECDATYSNNNTESVKVQIVDDSHCDDKCFKLDWSDKGDKVDTGNNGDNGGTVVKGNTDISTNATTNGSEGLLTENEKDKSSVPFIVLGTIAGTLLCVGLVYVIWTKVIPYYKEKSYNISDAEANRNEEVTSF